MHKQQFGMFKDWPVFDCKQYFAWIYKFAFKIWKIVLWSEVKEIYKAFFSWIITILSVCLFTSWIVLVEKRWRTSTKVLVIIKIKERNTIKQILPLLYCTTILSYQIFSSFIWFSPCTLYFPLWLCPSVSFYFHFNSDFFSLTRSDYAQPSLAITFYFKSTQPPDLPCFQLLFGSAVVIKMLPGSLSLLS